MPAITLNEIGEVTRNLERIAECTRAGLSEKYDADHMEQAARYFRQLIEAKPHIATKHIMWFVRGAVDEWARDSGETFSEEDQGRTYNVVQGYLNGTRVLNSTCSDLQRTIALEAEKVFGKSNTAIA